MALNVLHFNESKTEIIIFRSSSSNSASKLDLGPLTPYVKSMVTNLGVKLDSDFNLEKQINSVVKASFFQLRQITKLKPFLSFKDLERVIHAFITTRLDYCNSLYVGVNQATLYRLQIVQNAAARLLTGTRKREHIMPVLASLHWLPVCFRIQFKILLFVFKSLHGQAPAYIDDLLMMHAPLRSLRSADDLLMMHAPLRSLRSADQLLLAVPRTRLKNRGDRAFSVVAPRLWNDLPICVRVAPSVETFKSRLKTHLYSLAFKPD